MIEQWKDVRGFEGVYQISTHGRVKRMSAGSNTYVGRILHPAPNSDGYPTVTLYNKGSKRIVKVHNLVLETFVSP